MLYSLFLSWDIDFRQYKLQCLAVSYDNLYPLLQCPLHHLSTQSSDTSVPLRSTGSPVEYQMCFSPSTFFIDKASEMSEAWGFSWGLKKGENNFKRQRKLSLPGGGDGKPVPCCQGVLLPVSCREMSGTAWFPFAVPQLRRCWNQKVKSYARSADTMTTSLVWE